VKKILLISMVLFFGACSHIVTAKNSTSEKEKYDIYLLDEYKQLSLDKKVGYELAYTESEFKMFEKPFSEAKGYKKDESLTLSRSYDNVLEALKDRVFLKRFSKENLSTVVYMNNRVMPILFSKCGSCIGGLKYFMKLEGDILEMKILNEVAYDLVKPIPCKSEELK
jgi:hypothetical protein